jgi:hypothetical protein
MHCAFTAESFGFGRSGGVGRFMLVILPMVSVIALIGIDFLLTDENKWYKLLLGSISFLLLLLLWWRMDAIAPLVYHGYVTLSFTMYNIAALLITFVMVLALIFEAKEQALVAGLLAFIIALYTLRCVKPFPLIGEDKNMVTAISWLYQSNIHPRQVYANHPVACYEYGKRLDDWWQVKEYDLNTVAHAQPGDVFIVEVHYTGGNVRNQLLSSKEFTVLQKVDANNARQPAYVVVLFPRQ